MENKILQVSLAIFFTIAIIICVSRGREAVSRQAHNLEITGAIPVPATIYARVAQLAERGTHKPEVVGSIPTPGTL